MTENAYAAPSSSQPLPDELDFNPDELRARYRAERERRVRSDASGQYQ